MLKLRKLGLIPMIPVVLAPCGELSDGALRSKRAKKNMFLKAARFIKLYEGLIWKASTEFEADEIKRLDASNGRILTAVDMPPRAIFDRFESKVKPRKQSGKARLVFLSRVDPKKNLLWLIHLLGRCEYGIGLDVYGPAGDPSYLDSCRNAAKAAEARVSVNFRGPLKYETVPEVLFEYDFFVMPTLGENFGHVFIEALSAGVPLMISDTTPWRDLSEKGIGWSLPLDEPEAWLAKLKDCVNMGAEEYKRMSVNCRHFATKWLGDPSHESDTAWVLEQALQNLGRRVS